MKEEEKNIFDFGYNRDLILKEVAEKKRRAFKDLEDSHRKDRETKEKLRIQRIGRKHPLICTIDKIIEQCFIDKGKEKVFIDFYSLGFADNVDELSRARRFFNNLKGYGCFENVECSSNTWFEVTKPNLAKLREYKAIIEQKLGPKESQGKSNTVHEGTAKKSKSQNLNSQETRSIPLIKLEDENLKWGKAKIPMRRGQNKVMEILLQNQTIIRGRKVVRKGSSTNLEALRKEGGYNDERCLRNALKSMKSKIKEGKFPIKIYPHTTKNYIAEIRYSRKNWEKLGKTIGETKNQFPLSLD